MALCMCVLYVCKQASKYMIRQGKQEEGKHKQEHPRMTAAVSSALPNQGLVSVYQRRLAIASASFSISVCVWKSGPYLTPSSRRSSHQQEIIQKRTNAHTQKPCLPPTKKDKAHTYIEGKTKECPPPPSTRDNPTTTYTCGKLSKIASLNRWLTGWVAMHLASSQKEEEERGDQK